MPARVLAQSDAAPAAADKEKAGEKAPADKSVLPPLPADAHVQQSMQLDGKALHYTVTVSSLPVRDNEALKLSGTFGGLSNIPPYTI